MSGRVGNGGGEAVFDLQAGLAQPEGFDHLPIRRGEQQVSTIEGGGESGAGSGKGAGDDGGVGGQHAWQSGFKLPGIRAAQPGDELGGGSDELVDSIRPAGGQGLGAVGGEQIGQRAVGDLELGVELPGGEQALGLPVVVGVELTTGQRLRSGRPVGGTQERPDLTGIGPAQGAKLGRSRIDGGVERLVSLPGGLSKRVIWGILQSGEQSRGGVR